MSYSEHDQAVFIARIATNPLNLLQCGAAHVDSMYIFHLPTLWECYKTHICVLTDMAPEGDWSTLQKVFTDFIPGKVTPTYDPRVAAVLTEHNLKPEECAACVAPFDTTFIGRLPLCLGTSTPPDAPHWLLHLLLAVGDTVVAEGFNTTGVWVEPTTKRLVINWKIREQRHPLGSATPLLRPGMQIWDIPDRLLHSGDTMRIMRTTTTKMAGDALRFSPWLIHDGCVSVVNTEVLLDTWKTFKKQKVVNVDRSRKVWYAGFDPFHTQLLNDVDQGRWESWCRNNNLEVFRFAAVWLRTQWAVALPHGIFHGKLNNDHNISEEYTLRDKWIAEYRIGRKSVIYPEHNMYVFDNITYYTASMLEAFSKSAPRGHYYVFDAIATFLREATVHQQLIATAERRGKKPSTATERTPDEWTPQEDAALRQVFGQRDDRPVMKTVTPDAWEWLLGKNSRLEPGHRTKHAITRRISVLNRQLRRSLVEMGVETPEALLAFKAQRLGQRNRPL